MLKDKNNVISDTLLIGILVDVCVRDNYRSTNRLAQLLFHFYEKIFRGKDMNALMAQLGSAHHELVNTAFPTDN